MAPLDLALRLRPIWVGEDESINKPVIPLIKQETAEHDDGDNRVKKKSKNFIPGSFQADKGKRVMLIDGPMVWKRPTCCSYHYTLLNPYKYHRQEARMSSLNKPNYECGWCKKVFGKQQAYASHCRFCPVKSCPVKELKKAMASTGRHHLLH